MWVALRQRAADARAIGSSAAPKPTLKSVQTEETDDEDSDDEDIDIPEPVVEVDEILGEPSDTLRKHGPMVVYYHRDAKTLKETLELQYDDAETGEAFRRVLEVTDESLGTGSYGAVYGVTEAKMKWFAYKRLPLRCPKCEPKGKVVPFVVRSKKFLDDVPFSKVSCPNCSAERSDEDWAKVVHKEIAIANLLRMELGDKLKFPEGFMPIQPVVDRKYPTKVIGVLMPRYYPLPKRKVVGKWGPDKRCALAALLVSQVGAAMKLLRGIGVLWRDAKYDNYLMKKTENPEEERDAILLGDYGGAAAVAQRVTTPLTPQGRPIMVNAGTWALPEEGYSRPTRDREAAMARDSAMIDRAHVYLLSMSVAEIFCSPDYLPEFFVDRKVEQPPAATKVSKSDEKRTKVIALLNTWANKREISSTPCAILLRLCAQGLDADPAKRPQLDELIHAAGAAL